MPIAQEVFKLWDGESTKIAQVELVMVLSRFPICFGVLRVSISSIISLPSCLWLRAVLTALSWT